MRRRARLVVADRAVLFSIAGLAVLATAFAFVSATMRADQARTDREVTAALRQVELSREIFSHADAATTGAAVVPSELAGAVAMLERGHFGLRYGDTELGLDGVRDHGLEVAFTQAEPALTDVTRAARTLGDSSQSRSIGESLAASASAYERAMSDVATTLSGTAVDQSIRAQQIQLGAVATGFILMLSVLMLAAHRRETGAAAVKRAPEPREIDHLTGLVRRTYFREQLIAALSDHEAGDGFVGVLVVGLTPRLGVQRQLEPRLRDRAVQEAARRVRATVRSTDLVGRLGRDSLAISIEGTPRVDDAGRVAFKLQRALDAPMVIDGLILHVDIAIGIALAPIDASSADELVERATLAHRAARTAGGYRYYSSELRPGHGTREQIVANLREAIQAEDELWIAYQPKVRLSDETVVGYEALIRWNHPTLGELAPAEFIPMAEESDVIVDLGRWVIEEVCRQQGEWRNQHGHLVPVSINVSSRQFRQGDLTTDVVVSLDRHEVPSRAIEIELTEGVLLDGQELPIAHMERLQELGVRIAVDDFGTGYSSLSYLKRFPIDILKIDRSFIRELSDGNEDAAISTAIIALAHSLELEVVAEGVETREQYGVLQNLGCDTAQGFYFAEPVPAEDISAPARIISAIR